MNILCLLPRTSSRLLHAMPPCLATAQQPFAQLSVPLRRTPAPRAPRSRRRFVAVGPTGCLSGVEPLGFRPSVLVVSACLPLVRGLDCTGSRGGSSSYLHRTTRKTEAASLIEITGGTMPPIQVHSGELGGGISLSTENFLPPATFPCSLTSLASRPESPGGYSDTKDGP